MCRRLGEKHNPGCKRNSRLKLLTEQILRGKDRIGLDKRRYGQERPSTHLTLTTLTACWNVALRWLCFAGTRENCIPRFPSAPSTPVTVTQQHCLPAATAKHTKVSVDTIVQWIRLQPSGLMSTLCCSRISWMGGTQLGQGEVKMEQFDNVRRGCDERATLSDRGPTRRCFLAEKAYPKLTFCNRPPVGGHLAAWEQPAPFTADLRAGFSTLR